MPWLVADPGGVAVEPVRQFLNDFVAGGARQQSVRSYAYVLLRWWRWLHAVEVEWDRATSAEVRDLVLWLGWARKQRNAPRTVSTATVDTINLVTGKQYLGDGYKPRTVRHNNAVLRSFYRYWIEDVGGGPLVNPVQLQPDRGRPHAHHTVGAPFRAEGRIRYNPKVPPGKPREIPDHRWRQLFAGLRSNRDRALLALSVANGVRAGEVLALRGADLDWGDQLIRVIRKGGDREQWLPAGPDAFVWMRLYLADVGLSPGPADPVWWTLRRRDRGAGLRRQPMNYEALRAVFRRMNTLLGTNWSMHDLRHTAALRMARDEALSLRDVQTILGHRHLSTTAQVYLVEDQAQVVRRVRTYLDSREQRVEPPVVAAGYDEGDLAVLFDGGLR